MSIASNPHLPTLLGLAAAALGSVSAVAQAQPAPMASETQWGLGLSVGSIRKPYKDIDDRAVALPVLFVENRWLSISGLSADLKLPSTESVSFRLRARFDPSLGYEADDSPVLLGMEDRKAGLWLGGAVLWRTGVADVGVEVLGDASSYSKGQRATLTLQRRFALGSWSLTPRAEAAWLDRKNATYYHGVQANEATASRGFYEADSTVNSRLGLRVDYRLLPRDTLFLDMSATRLGSEVRDSPIIGRTSTSSVFFGYVHLF